MIPLLVAACTSLRYVGSIGRDGTYSNRGYGLAIRLAEGGLAERWNPIDPTKLDQAPRKWRPLLSNEPLDVDADGLLEVTERQQHTRPTLRLLSRTSSAARMEVNVRILGGENQNVPLEAVIAAELKRWSGTSTTALSRAVSEAKKRRLARNFDARVSEIVTEGRFLRVAVIDQPDFVAEEGITRRQVVSVVLRAPGNTGSFLDDHEQLLKAVILNRRGGSETVREKW